MQSLSLITPPAIEPISLEEAKAHLRVDGDGEDLLISGLISSARAMVEERCARVLMVQEWQLVLDRFPNSSSPIVLPLPPFQHIVSINYVGTDGLSAALDPANYRVVKSHIHSHVIPTYGKTWPDTLDDVSTVSINFKAGYANATMVPSPIKAWMKIMIGTLWENRDVVIRGDSSTATILPRGYVDGLLDPYIVPSLA